MLPSFKWWFKGSGESGGTGSTQNRDQQRRLQFQHRGLNNQVNLNNFIQIDKFKLVDYVKSARKMIPICRFSARIPKLIMYSLMLFQITSVLDQPHHRQLLLRPQLRREDHSVSFNYTMLCEYIVLSVLYNCYTFSKRSDPLIFDTLRQRQL